MALLLSLLSPIQIMTPAYGQEDEFAGFFEDPELLGSESIYNSDSPINDQEEEDLAAQYMLEMMDMQSSLCRDDNGKFKVGEIKNPLSDEPIDCSAFTLLQYQLIEQEANADLAYKCISQGRKPVEALKLLRTLGIEAEKHFKCPGKDEDMKECMNDLICNTLKSSGVGLAAKALEYVGVPPMRCETSTDSNCLTEAFWGIWKNLVTNVEAAWGLLKLGWNGVKWVGGKIKDGVVGAGKKVLNFFGLTRDIEDQVEMSHHMIAQQEDSFFSDFLKNPISTTKDLLSKLFNSFKQYIGEAIGNNFGCTKWSSSRFNPLDGEEAFCEEPVVSWDCATCSQKMNMACGVVGFVGGEILTSFVAGKALAYGAKMSQFTKLNVAASKVAKTKAASKVAKAGKFVGSKITGAFSFGAGAVMGLVKASGKWAIKMGGKLVPLTAKTKAKLLKILAGAGKYGKLPFSAAGKGAKKYMELIENSFVLGYQGKHGLKALQTSRKITQIEKQIQTMKASVKAGDTGQMLLIQKQMEALDSLKEYRTLLKAAVASKGDKASYISRMKSKLSEYLKRRQAMDKHSIALRASSRSSNVKKFIPSNQERTIEALLVKEGVGEKFVKGVASKSETRRVFTANKERLFEASQIAGRKLSKAEKTAILKAHYTGTRNAAGKFSLAEMRKKYGILRDAGLKDISRGLMQSNVTGMEALYPIAISSRETIYIIQTAGLTGTSPIILNSIKERLDRDEIRYVGHGIFVTNDEEEKVVLKLDKEKDKSLIEKLDNKLKDINGSKEKNQSTQSSFNQIDSLDS